MTVFASNAGAGLPTHLATILLFDAMTGELVAIMDGRYITEARTAAVSAVATELLAREDAAVLAVIGSGVQARSHVDAIGRIRDVPPIRAWSPNADRLAAFVRETRRRTEADVIRLRVGREAVNGAEIVVLATVGPRTGRAQRVDRRRRARLRRWRVPADPARNGHRAGRSRPRVRRFEKRGAGRGRRCADTDPRRGRSTRRTSSASSGSCSREPFAAG